MSSQQITESTASRSFGEKLRTPPKYPIWGLKRNQQLLFWGMLLTGLISTWIGAAYVKHEIELRAKQEFDFACSEINNKIIARLSAHAQLLRSGSAYLQANANVTRKEWRVFIEHQGIESSLPGIQGIGYSVIISPGQLASHEQKVRKEGFPEYAVKPPGERDIYTSIVYLEPMSGRNLRAFGYDMFSETIRRTAMEYARDYNVATLSGKITLVQETQSDIQAGTLMYVPVYEKTLSTGSIAERRAAIRGWVYSPYRMNDLMKGILGGYDIAERKQIHLMIFDDSLFQAKGLLYDSRSAVPQNTQTSPVFSNQAPITFNNHAWYIRCTQDDTEASRIDYAEVWIVSIEGIIGSVLLGLLYLILINVNNRAFLLADVLTKDLQESKEKFRIVADFTYSWEYWERDDQVIVYMSPSCKRITGYEPEEFISDPALLKTIVHPDDAALFDQHKNSVLVDEHRNEICELEFRVIRKDGAILHMYHLCRPIFNEQREYLGRRVSNRDITERKLAETERERMITELQGALEQIKTLKGIVPICSDCKKVRDDKGYWEQVESYVQRHSDAKFSHGLCPDCVEKYFPKYVKDMQNKPKM